METQFELEWLGGPAASLLRRRRPGIDELPWGSIDISQFTPETILEARKVWTNGTFTEYVSCAAFSAISGALLACGAPIDLIAAASDFAVDEMSHTELAARLVMSIGGAVPYVADLNRLTPLTTKDASPIVTAAELVIKTSSVGEALSVPTFAASVNADNHPLFRVVLERLLHEEGPHSAFSEWFFDWADERLSDEDRAHLAGVALKSISVFAPLWKNAPCPTCVLDPKVGGPQTPRPQTLRDSVIPRIAKPLSRHGIILHEERLTEILSYGPSYLSACAIST